MKFSRIITAIDTHSSGEATRIITGGIPKLPGKNMTEKQAHFQKHFDGLRKTLLQEPRGSAGLLGAVITEPTIPEADVGVIYLWTGGYFSACGDSTYSVSAMFLPGSFGMPPVMILVASPEEWVSIAVMILENFISLQLD